MENPHKDRMIPMMMSVAAVKAIVGVSVMTTLHPRRLAPPHHPVSTIPLPAEVSQSVGVGRASTIHLPVLQNSHLVKHFLLPDSHKPAPVMAGLKGSV